MPKRGFYSAGATTGAKRAKQKKQGKEGDIAMHLLPGAKSATYIKTQANKSKQLTIKVLFEPSHGLDCA